MALTAPTPMEQTAPTKERLSPNLGRLVGDDRTAEFLKSYFGRDAFRRRLPNGEAARLFSWDLLNQALAEHRLGPPRLKLEKGGLEVGRGLFRERRSRPNQILHDLDVAGLYEHLRDGATLILDAVNELHQPLQRLCTGLGGEFCASSQANLYACWGETLGFDVHWDDHDVFVIQLDGAKRWDLYGITQPSPLRRGDNPAAKPTREPKQIVLEAGDMLYLPRGYWHAAVGLGGPSLHLTIGLSRKTGADLLRWLADEAVAVLSVRADLLLEQDDDVLGEQVAEILRTVLSREDPAELARRYRRNVEAGFRHRPQLSFPQIGCADSAFARDARFRLTAGATDLQSIDDPPSVRFSHRGVRYALARETAPVMRDLLAGAAICYADFVRRCVPASEQVVASFVREMLSKGVFALEPEG